MSLAKKIALDERKELVNSVIKDLKNGVTPFWQKRWNSAIPKNATTDNNYRGINWIKLNIISQEMGYKDNRWLTFPQAKSKKWNIKKGEKATKLEFWNWYIVKRVIENGEEKEIKEKRDIPLVSYFNVFNAEQFENIPENKILNLDFQNNERIENIIKNVETKIQYRSIDRAFYSPITDTICLPNREYFKSENEFYSTLLHEIAHSTGHESRLNREKHEQKADKIYAKEELIAELTSMFLQQDLGINIQEDNILYNSHKAYLKHYIELLEEIPNVLFSIIREAEKASDYILNYARN